jgi:3D (Asp-Asp-Asp) domain-containing protein
LLGALAGCSIIPKGLGDYDAGFKERGEASWYGAAFAGRLTASGEIYDQYKLTAAHRLLPLGTWVRVMNAVNGRSVEVVINDRGPYIDGRIIDLSYAAAEQLDMIDSGTSPVIVEVIREEFVASPSAVDRNSPGLGEWTSALLPSTWGSRYGDMWLVPRGPQLGAFAWHPLDLRDERRSRRLSQLLEDFHPIPLPQESGESEGIAV